jgi:hypothetical protein
MLVCGLLERTVSSKDAMLCLEVVGVYRGMIMQNVSALVTSTMLSAAALVTRTPGLAGIATTDSAATKNRLSRERRLWSIIMRVPTQEMGDRRARVKRHSYRW